LRSAAYRAQLCVSLEARRGALQELRGERAGVIANVAKVMLSWLVLFTSCAAAAQVRTTGNLRALGQDVGVLVSRIAAQPESFEVTRNLGQPALVNPQVAAAAARATQKAAERRLLPAADVVCERDLAARCPETWVLHGAKCVAPQSYAGPCAANAVADWTPAEKQNFAAQCDVAWPCAGACKHNFDVCPEGWESSADGSICQRQSSKQGNCSDVDAFVLGMLSTPRKQELMVACGLDWPCAAEHTRPCMGDEICPDGWQRAAGVCVADPAYTGDCEFEVNTSGWGAKQRAAFAMKCDVSWPCTDASSTLS